MLTIFPSNFSTVVIDIIAMKYFLSDILTAGGLSVILSYMHVDFYIVHICAVLDQAWDK